MKCPKCKREGLKYIEPRRETDKKQPIKRTNFKAKCKCGWVGKI